MDIAAKVLLKLPVSTGMLLRSHEF